MERRGDNGRRAVGGDGSRWLRVWPVSLADVLNRASPASGRGPEGWNDILSPNGKRGGVTTNTRSDGGSLSYGRRAARLYQPLVAAVTFGRYRPFLAREVVRLGLGPADRILGLCRGTGLAARELARRLGPGGEVVGVDASEAMLEQATLAGGRVVYVRAEADSLPRPDGHFDCVTIFLGLHEITQAARRPGSGPRFRLGRTSPPARGRPPCPQRS